VSQRREALSARANTGKFLGLRAKKPVRQTLQKQPNTVKDLTAKHGGKVAAFGTQKDPAKCSNGWCRSIISSVGTDKSNDLDHFAK